MSEKKFTLTLPEYVTGIITGYYPDDERSKTYVMDALQKREFQSYHAADFRLTNNLSMRLEVQAISLAEQNGQIVGVFRGKEGEIYCGTWSHSRQEFLGTQLPVDDVTPIKVGYNTEIEVYPPCAHIATARKDKGRPIFLMSGVPTRHATTSNGSYHRWEPLKDNDLSTGDKFGWVQLSD